MRNSWRHLLFALGVVGIVAFGFHSSHYDVPRVGVVLLQIVLAIYWAVFSYGIGRGRP